MEMVLIRHGRSLGDDLDRIEGAGWDAPLTEAGLAQARLLAERITREGFRADVLFSSPLARARRTAEMATALTSGFRRASPESTRSSRGKGL